MWDEPKQNRGAASLLSSIFMPSFSFMTPLPLEQCITRLKAKSERKQGVFVAGSRLPVEVSPAEGGVYFFILSLDIGRNYYVEVLGSLYSYQASWTVVSGHARLGRSTLRVTLLFILAVVFFFLLGPLTKIFPPFSDWKMTLLYGIVLVLLWVRLYSGMMRIVRGVYDTLRDQIS